MKRICITGCAGFIGFHTALHLKKRGDHVVGIDNFNDFYDPALKKKRAELLHEAGIEVITGDICDRPLMEELCKKNHVTHFLHLAAQAGVRYALTHPDAYLKSNLEGFLSVLEVLRLMPEIKLTYASSSSVYGCNEKTPFSTSDVTDKPANLYAATKKANELMSYSYYHLFGIQAIGLRYFTVYGPWGRPDMAYYLFTDAILKNKPIRLYNEGKMSRDFTYIDDVVAGTVAALDSEIEWGVFNIGNRTPIALMTLVETLEQLLGKRAQKVFEKNTKGEVAITYADISDSEEKLHFHPQVSIENGLSHFVSWYLDYVN